MGRVHRIEPYKPNTQGLADQSHQSDQSQINQSMQIRWPINWDQSGSITDQ